MLNAASRRVPWSLKRGDAVLLTAESTRSFSASGEWDGPDTQLVGMVFDRLGDTDDEEAVWGVLVNGEFHQVLDSEIESVMPVAPS